MGSKQRGRKGGQGFGNAKPARPLRQMRLGKRRQLPDTPGGRLQEFCEKTKARIRAKVEHVFRVLKQQLVFTKTRLRGLKESF